ncbi:MAG: ComF family protein [Actinobacteria bacterium]|nr:ComF family protein [Actinomycetota bacterium]
MANTIERPAADAVLVPVPLSPRRRRLGGANHARLLAIHLAREWGLPVVEALARRVDGPSQRGRGRTARLRQVVGAFTSVGPTIGGPVVLVDDVHTTGATIGACARVLRRAGAADVGAVTFARVWSER